MKKVEKQYKWLIVVLLFLFALLLFQNIAGVLTISNMVIIFIGYIATLTVGVISIYKDKQISPIERILWLLCILLFNLWGLLVYYILNRKAPDFGNH